MNDAVRLARLKGVREAERILAILDVRPRLRETYERVDVFDALAWLDVRVMFRPLEGLLGAYMRGAQPGALISTRRPLSVQRFTAAHELGHAILNHEPSLDSPNVLRRAAYSQFHPKVSGFASYVQEIEADAFAGAFLLPIWLVTHHARKHGWSRNDLAAPDIVYQLSLRCGASFQATIWALERHRIISAEDRNRLLNVKPKALKSHLGHALPVAETRADAWSLTKEDASSAIPTVLGDTVTVVLDQLAGAGYLWSKSGSSEFLEELNSTVSMDSDLIGAASISRTLFKTVIAGNAKLDFAHKRPWEHSAFEKATFCIKVNEPEKGLSRANRSRLLAQVTEQRKPNAF